MKVKVSYTVDFDNIPEVIKSIVENSESALDQLKEINRHVLSGELGIESVKELERAKEIVDLLMDIYEDSEGITRAYIANSLSPASLSDQPSENKEEKDKENDND